MLKKNKAFRMLFFAYGLSTLGDWFDFIAVSIMLGYFWHADPMTMALLPIAYAAPGILLGQFAGVLADRGNKVRLLMGMDVLQGLFTLLLLAMPSPIWFLAVISLRSSASVFTDPAQQALTRKIVSPDQLLQASSLNGAVFQLGKLIGPLIGGFVAAFFAPAICLMVNACSFFLSAVLLFTIRRVEEKNGASETSREEALSFRQSWTEGWNVFLQNRTLLFSTVFSLLAMMAIQLADAQFPVIFREKVPDNPEMIGYTVSVIGMGALLTVTWLHRRKEIRSFGWVLGGGVLLIGLCFLWIGLYQPGDGMYWLLAAALLAGIGTGLTTVGGNYLVQKLTPPEALGRVRGIINSLSSVMFIIAPLLGGVLITVCGASFAFSWVGFFTALIGSGAVIFQRLIWGKSKAPAAVISEHA